MNPEQAQQLRKKLVYLEGIFAPKTREYIWKVLIGPEVLQQFEAFRLSIDPTRPLDPTTALRPYMREELSVYFFLKRKGILVSRLYEEFLRANDMLKVIGPELFHYVPLSGGYNDKAFG